MTRLLRSPGRLWSSTGRLARDTSGLALLEFAFAFPLVLMAGLYGVETANLALMNLKVSQIALNLADNSSRVGIIGSNQIEQLREVDINDVMDAVRNQGKSINLTTYGRVTITSLENASGVQRIHWQRCLGMKSKAGYDSSYGITAKSGSTSNADYSKYDPAAGMTSTATGTIATGGPANSGAVVGMGENNSVVAAPADGGVMFIEINYDYQPVVGGWLLGKPKIHYTASFIVRDNRDFTQIFNPAPGDVLPANIMTCDKTWS